MRVTVLGGSGFLGSRAVSALRAVPGFEVQVASRRGPVTVDAARPETFNALEGCEVVIDLIDATTSAPDVLIGWCLEKGLTVIECTSDGPVIERLHARFSGRAHAGRLVLGGGLFTGVSNLLGAAVAKAALGLQSLQLAVSVSPFSGAGSGTISLMVEGMGVAPVVYREGLRVELLGMEEGPEVIFVGVSRPTVRTNLAEAFMLHTSTGAPNVEVLLAPKPSFLAAAFRMLPLWLIRSRFFVAYLRVYFTLLRKLLLRRVAASVELVATAKGQHALTRTVTCADGMRAGAWALAASVELMPPTGVAVAFLDQLVALEAVIARANVLAGAEVLKLS